MKKGIILLLAVCLFCCGCSPRLIAELSDHSGFFYRFSAGSRDGLYLVKGTACQSKEDENLILLRLAAEEDSTVTVTGKSRPVKGDIRLVYTAPDGTETVIADKDDRDIDEIVSVQKGEGAIGFIPCGSADRQSTEAVVDFDFQIKAAEGVKLTGHEPEGLEELELTEKTRRKEAFPEIKDKWPESIVFDLKGIYAQPLIADIEVEEPVAVSVVYASTGGEMRLKIENENGEVYFDKDNVRAVDAGDYTVDLDEAGTYRILLYAKYLEGEIEIRPSE